MFLNALPAQPQARQPRGLVKVFATINGNPVEQIVPGWVNFEVDNNSYYAADTFRVTFATSMLPPTFNANFWSSQSSDIFIEIFAGFPTNPDNPKPSELESLIYARVDDIEFDPIKAEISLTGRDMTAAFIDAKTTQKWENHTSSQIAIALALSHNLGINFITPTKAIVGDYYKYLNIQPNDARSEWDLLTNLAAIENFYVYVKGSDLHFEVAPLESAKDVYQLTWNPPTADRGYPIFNGMSLNLSRSMTIGKGIQVTVQSYSHEKKQQFKVSYPSKSKGTQVGKASPFGNVQIYLFQLSGKTYEFCLKYATNKYNELVSHEMKLVARLPADNKLHVSDALQVVGTGTAYDQIYFPNSIVRQMGHDEGYTMTIHAKNHAADSVPSL